MNGLSSRGILISWSTLKSLGAPRAGLMPFGKPLHREVRLNAGLIERLDRVGVPASELQKRRMAYGTETALGCFRCRERRTKRVKRRENTSRVLTGRHRPAAFNPQ